MQKSSYYLGAPEHPAPFGGRAADLAALDAWLNDPNAPPYALLAAPAGRGKSALLAHWVTRLTASSPEANGVHIVYFPVSIRFNTNLETVAFASLAARMAHIFGEKVTQAIDAQQYGGVFSEWSAACICLYGRARWEPSLYFLLGRSADTELRSSE